MKCFERISFHSSSVKQSGIFFTVRTKQIFSSGRMCGFSAFVSLSKRSAILSTGLIFASLYIFASGSVYSSRKA